MFRRLNICTIEIVCFEYFLHINYIVSTEFINLAFIC